MNSGPSSHAEMTEEHEIQRRGMNEDNKGQDRLVWQGARTTYLVKQLEMLLRSRMEPIVRAARVTVPQYTALSILESSPRLSSAQLARSTFVSAQSANELVNSLYGKGLILRTSSPEHAKILLLELSEDGREILTSCANRINELEGLMLGALEGNAAKTFHDNLRSCISALDLTGSASTRSRPVD